jgi:hypothetical protein
MNKEKFIKGFILSTMIGLYAIVSLISTLHVIEFFEMSNPRWLAISLAIAFEIGAAASLASIIVLEKTSKTLVWSLFILLTAMQMQGNMFYAYTHLENFQGWIDLFGLQEEELITQKRILSIVSGAILPVIALGFIKSLVDYIRPETPIKESTEIPSIEEPIEILPEPQAVKEVQPEPKVIQHEAEAVQKPLREVTQTPQPETFGTSLPILDAKTGNVVVEPMVTTPFKKYESKP